MYRSWNENAMKSAYLIHTLRWNKCCLFLEQYKGILSLQRMNWHYPNGTSSNDGTSANSSPSPMLVTKSQYMTHSHSCSLEVARCHRPLPFCSHNISHTRYKRSFPQRSCINFKGTFQQEGSRTFATKTKGSTIFSVSSGHGKCGVAVVRVSGPASTDTILHIARRDPMPSARHTHLLRFYHPHTGEVIDKGLLIWFPGKNGLVSQTCT